MTELIIVIKLVVVSLINEFSIFEHTRLRLYSSRKKWQGRNSVDVKCQPKVERR